MRKTIALILVICVLALCMVSCFGTGSTTTTTPPTADAATTPEPEPEPTAYEKLTEQEKTFFDAFKGKMAAFNDPSSVTILSFTASLYDSSLFIFKVSAKNGFGGTATEEYVLFAKKWLCPGASKETYYPLTSPAYGALAGTIVATDDLGSGPFNSVAISYIGYQEAYSYIDDTKPEVAKINAALKEYKTEQGW